jgi:hypothetical protein
VQEIGYWIPSHGAALVFDVRDHLIDDVRVKSAQCPVRLDVPIVASRRVSYELICSHQASKAIPERRARRHVVHFVDDQA